MLRLPLPVVPAAVLVPLLTSPAGLRRWWDPGAGFVGARLAPGIDGEAMAVRGDSGGAVVWEGDALRVRFDLVARTVTVAAEGVDAAAEPDLVAGWALALAALGWAAERDGDVRWLRVDAPVALAYTDAWSRLTGPGGLASGAVGAAIEVRIGAATYEARVVLADAPRAVALVLPGLEDALVRLQIGPGESVNTARLELLHRGAGPMPTDWEAWLSRRLGMTWVAQLGPEG